MTDATRAQREQLRKHIAAIDGRRPLDGHSERAVGTFSKRWIKLRNKAYRDAFVATQLKRGIPFQFRAMRKKLGLSQVDVARLAGVSQGVISRAEDSDYGNLTFNNVLRIAAGLDVAFVGRLVPFSDLAKWFDNLSEESVQVPTFEEEDQAMTLGGDPVAKCDGPR